MVIHYLKTKAEEILEKKLKTYQEKLAELAKTEQERRQRYIDHFSASLAHEIVNPVFGISGTAQMFKAWVDDDVKKKLSPEEFNYANENISRISRDADRVLKLVKTVREFSSANSGEINFIELDKVIEGFRIIAEPQFKYNGIDFSFESVPGIKLNANKVYLEEVLMSLASNAIDAVSQNQGNKIVKMKVSSDVGVCRIEFSDNGCGIEPDRLESIFLDFVTTKASSQASGMGLSRARKIVKLHNGKIWAESEGIGKGAKFVIELPIVS